MKKLPKLTWGLGLICILVVILAVIFLRPVADLDFLYSYYPETKGHIPAGTIGTRVTYFLDPSFYYKFSANEAEAVKLAELLKLEPVSSIDSTSPAFRATGMFWHDWFWWQPNAGSTSKLFHAYRDGNDIYLAYDFRAGVIYLYIQNT